jgi:hypothetical protein
MLTDDKTTNRMGQIDDAFLSRIQVALGYSKLSNDAQMSIWEGFFEKLEDERSDIVISQRAKTFVLTDEKFRKMGWNGREIRNGEQFVSVSRSSKSEINLCCSAPYCDCFGDSRQEESNSERISHR